MNNIQIFNNEKFGRVRIIMSDENKPMFLANDVAKSLGYANPRKAIGDHCKGVTKRDTPTTSGVQVVSYIPESDVYRLVMRSKLPQAEQFQDWVCDEVLPSIRKTGGYMSAKETDTPEMIMARAVLVANDTIARQKQQLEQAQKAGRGTRAESRADGQGIGHGPEDRRRAGGKDFESTIWPQHALPAAPRARDILLQSQ